MGGEIEPPMNEARGHVVGGEAMIRGSNKRTSVCRCFVMLNVLKLKCSDDDEGF